MAQFKGTVEQLENSVAKTEAISDYVIGRTTQEVSTGHTTPSSITWDIETWASGRVVLNCHSTVRSSADPASVFSTKCVMPVTMKDSNYYIHANQSKRGISDATPTIFPYYEKTATHFWIGSDKASIDFDCTVIGYIDV